MNGRTLQLYEIFLRRLNRENLNFFSVLPKSDFMKIMKHFTHVVLFLLLFSFAFITVAHAFDEADPHNTYQWPGDDGDWFEWWYYKVVDPSTGESFFFTYGIVNPWDFEKDNAMVQVGNYGQHLSSTHHFPVGEFFASSDSTDVYIGENTATDKRITGHFQEADGSKISWDLSINKEWSFNAMGWTMNYPGISGIFWYPAQASATMNGWIRYGEKTYVLANAPAYQDRNWGRSFPKWWTWLVSNNFKNSPGTVLAAGGGDPKIFNAVHLISGLSVGLKYKDKEYAFRTPDGDHFDFDIKWGKWEVTASNNTNKIEISAYAPKEKFLLLPFQTPAGEEFYDYETLTGQMTVRLYTYDSDKSDWALLTTLETDEAGIEWGSPTPVDFDKLFEMKTTLQ